MAPGFSGERVAISVTKAFDGVGVVCTFRCESLVRSHFVIVSAPKESEKEKIAETWSIHLQMADFFASSDSFCSCIWIDRHNICGTHDTRNLFYLLTHIGNKISTNNIWILPAKRKTFSHRRTQCIHHARTEFRWMFWTKHKKLGIYFLQRKVSSCSFSFISF